MGTEELLKRAQEYFEIENLDGVVQLCNHPERIDVVAPLLKGVFSEKGKTRVIIDYDPGFPYFLIRTNHR